jgi:multiple RNA-binding domain-containing protein 1
MAYIQFHKAESAEKAKASLDGTSFQGRLLHILPALDHKTQKPSEYDLSQLPLKKQKALKRKLEASSASFCWNSMYMNPDAVLSSVADRLGVSKSALLDPASTDAAVKQAHAETHVIQETRAYFKESGINLDAFQERPRDDRILLVKNFAYGITTDDLRSTLEPYGQLTQLLVPPSGTIAIVQYSAAAEAKQAMTHLSYRNLKGSILFIEKGPKGLFDSKRQYGDKHTNHSSKTKAAEVVPESSAVESSFASFSTLFIRNLNFSTSSAGLKDLFAPLAGFHSASVKTKSDPKKPGELLSMGYGFVDFRSRSEAQAAMAALNGHKLDGHELVIRESRKDNDPAGERRREDASKKGEAKRTKIIIKNLPFEASKKDVRSLFGTYGQLRSVRVPKKFDHTTRGFAFADFVNAQEAQSAIEALTNTHLLGRRLVLEFAEGDTVDPEAEIRAMEKKINQQNETMAINSATRSARRKFTVDVRDDLD